MSEESNVNWSRASLFAVSMTTLGHAIQIHDGELGPRPYPTIAWLTIAIVAAVLANFLPPLKEVGRRWFQLIVTLCLLANFAQLGTSSPFESRYTLTPHQMLMFTVLLLIAAVLCGRVVADQGFPRILSFASVLLVFAFMGQWIITNVPDPHIDVYVFQADASAALADGRDPYAITSADIYGPQANFYGPGIVKNGRVQIGYPYLGETLLAIMPATFLHLDLRYSHLGAILLATVLIVVASPDLLGFSAAVLFLTTPRIFFVLEFGWIEPLMLLTLAATVACAVRWPKLLPIALGLFLASKQYIPFAAALVFVGSRPMRDSFLLLIKAAVAALLVVLPLALWDFPAFYRSTIAVQFRQPFRPDALSYLAWAGEASWSKSALVIVPFAALFTALGAVLWRRRSMGFAAAVAFCLFMFFAFNKQAFANYYFFVVGATGCAMAELGAVNRPKNGLGF